MKVFNYNPGVPATIFKALIQSFTSLEEVSFNSAGKQKSAVLRNVFIDTYRELRDMYVEMVAEKGRTIATDWYNSIPHTLKMPYPPFVFSFLKSTDKRYNDFDHPSKNKIYDRLVDYGFNLNFGSDRRKLIKLMSINDEPELIKYILSSDFDYVDPDQDNIMESNGSGDEEE